MFNLLRKLAGKQDSGSPIEGIADSSGTVATAKAEIFPDYYIAGYRNAGDLRETAGSGRGWNEQYIISMPLLCSAAFILIAVHHR
jgi:hypothetical protein